MTVERFYDAMLRREAVASVRLDGETWSLPRFHTGEEVWAYGFPGVIVGYGAEGSCGVHAGEYVYQVRFNAGSDRHDPWLYCESQLTPRTT